MFSLPEPLETLASMKRISPPKGVHAKPVATPGTVVRSATSLKYFCLPRNSSTSSVLTSKLSSSPAATLAATPRQTPAICLSRPLTPDSRVYSSMIRSIASSSMVIWSVLRPFSFTCFGIRYFLAICVFSSSV